MARRTTWINFEVLEAILARHGQEGMPWAAEARPYAVREADLLVWITNCMARDGRSDVVEAASGQVAVDEIRARGRAVHGQGSSRSPARRGAAVTTARIKPPPPGAILHQGQAASSPGGQVGVKPPPPVVAPEPPPPGAILHQGQAASSSGGQVGIKPPPPVGAPVATATVAAIKAPPPIMGQAAAQAPPALQAAALPSVQDTVGAAGPTMVQAAASGSPGHALVAQVPIKPPPPAPAGGGQAPVVARAAAAVQVKLPPADGSMAALVKAAAAAQAGDAAGYAVALGQDAAKATVPPMAQGPQIAEPKPPPAAVVEARQSGQAVQLVWAPHIAAAAGPQESSAPAATAGQAGDPGGRQESSAPAATAGQAEADLRAEDRRQATAQANMLEAAAIFHALGQVQAAQPKAPPPVLVQAEESQPQGQAHAELMAALAQEARETEARRRVVRGPFDPEPGQGHTSTSIFATGSLDWLVRSNIGPDRVPEVLSEGASAVEAGSWAGQEAEIELSPGEQVEVREMARILDEATVRVAEEESLAMAQGAWSDDDDEHDVDPLELAGRETNLVQVLADRRLLLEEALSDKAGAARRVKLCIRDVAHAEAMDMDSPHFGRKLAEAKAALGAQMQLARRTERRARRAGQALAWASMAMAKRQADARSAVAQEAPGQAARQENAPSSGAGSAAARSRTPGRGGGRGRVQGDDWVCPRCSSHVFAKHRGCVNCAVDREGRELPALEVPWRCGGCGFVNDADRARCQGKPAQLHGARCGPLRSITGQMGREYRGRDFACPACFEELGMWIRTFGRSDACVNCHTPVEELEQAYGNVPLVQDFPEGYFSERGLRARRP